MTFFLIYLLGQDLLNLYDEKQYDEGINILTSQKIENGEKYFNLANFYFRKDLYAEAIFNYLKASELMPRDPDIAYNLEYTLKKIGSDPYPNDYRYYLSLSFLLNSKEKLIFLIVFAAIFWILLMIYIFFRNNKIKYSLIVFLILSVLMTIPNIFNTANFGIVKIENANIYSGRGRDNVVLFTVPFVTKVETVMERDDWVQVKIDKTRRGWIASNELLR